MEAGIAFDTCWYDELYAHFYLVWSVFKGENPTYVSLFEGKNCKVGLCSDIYRPIFFKLGMMVEFTKFFILIPV